MNKIHIISVLFGVLFISVGVFFVRMIVDYYNEIGSIYALLGVPVVVYVFGLMAAIVLHPFLKRLFLGYKRRKIGMNDHFVGYQIKAENVNEAFNDLLEILLLKGNRIEIEEDSKGKRSGGKTIELQSLTVLIEKPSPYIQVPPILSNVSQKFMDGMLFQSTDKPQSKRVIDQKQDVIDILKQRPHTRRACMAVWERTDLKAPYSVCLAYIQFLIRDNKLHQSVVYRSHDMYNAFIYNAKGCIMLQHEIANELGVDIGTYMELNISAHIYKIDEDKVIDYIKKE